jgi:hypothetical protein
MRSSVLLLLAALWLATAGAGAARADDDEDNPHEKMVRSKTVCLDCHTKLPKADEHAADYFLVDAPSETCLGCHSETEHAGVREHAGKDAGALPGDENGKIACFTCHDPHPPGTVEGRGVHKSTVNAETRAFLAARTLPRSAERREPSEEFGALLRTPDAVEGCRLCHAEAGSDEETKRWRERTLWSERMRVLPSY